MSLVLTKKQTAKNVAGLIVVIFIFLAMIRGCINFAQYTNWHEQQTYTLSEFEDGTYGIYTQVVSTTPSHNYEMITLLLNGNTVHTFKGNVIIHYTDGTPKAVVDDYNVVYGDDIFVYVPAGTIKFHESVGAGG